MAYGRLTIFHPDGRREVVDIDRATFRIGSTAENDLVLGDPQVAPQHAQILSDDRGSELLDISGTGVTDLDGTLLTAPIPLPLRDGSVIRIGTTLITVTLGPAAPPVDAKDQALLDDLLGQSLRGPAVTPVFGKPLPPDPDRHAAPTVPSPVLPPDDAPPRPAQIFIKLNNTQPLVDAGQSAQLTATISNRSEIVDQIVIAVEGLPDEWVSVMPAMVNLYPGDSTDVVILITPPRRPESHAGLHDMRVVAQMQTRPHEQATAEAELTIHPFDEFFLSLEPVQMAGWRSATYTMRLENAGNREQFFQYRGSDDENILRISFSPPPLLPVEAGEIRTVKVRVHCTRARLIGNTPQMYGFRIVANPTEGIDEQNPPLPREAGGRFVQRPLFQSCVVPATIIATVLAMILGCIGLLYQRRATLRPIVCPVATVPFFCPTLTPTLDPIAVLTAEPVPTLIPTPDAGATVAAVEATRAAED
ncbi:MAG TPA: FHA domain-containing protein, partial [Roseiflexaceae bacterium]|nr:FHA domain-containing protein [Roseiflexaceae bacterium]